MDQTEDLWVFVFAARSQDDEERRVLRNGQIMFVLFQLQEKSCKTSDCKHTGSLWYSGHAGLTSQKESQMKTIFNQQCHPATNQSSIAHTILLMW